MAAAAAAAAMAERATFTTAVQPPRIPLFLPPPAPAVRALGLTEAGIDQAAILHVANNQRFRLHTRAQSDLHTRFKTFKLQLKRRNSLILDDDEVDTIPESNNTNPAMPSSSEFCAVRLSRIVSNDETTTDDEAASGKLCQIVSLSCRLYNRFPGPIKLAFLEVKQFPITTILLCLPGRGTLVQKRSPF